MSVYQIILIHAFLFLYISFLNIYVQEVLQG